MNSDVLIIGGGVIGLAIARALDRRRAGKITVLERGRLGGEASLAAAGMLAPHAETDKLDDFYHFCHQSNKLYPEFAAELLNETKIDIELDRQGTLYLALTARDQAEIERRYEWQKAAKLAVERLTARETRQAEPFVSPDACGSLFFPDDWQVENRRLLAALQKYAELYQINICEERKVKNLIVENNRVRGAQTVRGEKFYAGETVLATGAWTSLITAESAATMPLLQLLPPVKPIRGQMIGFRTAKRVFSKVIYSPRGYLVPRRDGRILIGATVEDAGFDKTVTPAGAASLRQTALEIAPSLANLEIAESWAGLRPFAADGLPILGGFPPVENLNIAAAHYRNGILLAPLTANLLADKIVGGAMAAADSAFLQAFGPRRLQTVGAG